MSKLEKRDEIARAALGLIAENGFHGAPMAMIAEKAGVGAGTIYRYFENKDILINELYRDLEERIYPIILCGYEQKQTIRNRFLHMNSAMLRYFIENPLDFRFLEQFHNSPFGVAHRRDKILGKKKECDIFLELFREGIAQKIVKDLPLVILFALSFGPILTVTRDHILGFIKLDDVLIDQTVAACWDAITA
jgi:AcrR family transcriptional regulator